MRRFRLLGFYVAGLAALIGLAVGGVSMRRAATEGGTPEARVGGTQGAPAPKAGPPAHVSIADFAFGPKELVIAAGTAVTWVNADDVPHTVTGRGSPPPFDSRTLRAGATFSFEFRAPGTYDYFCKAHPNMTGRVVVK